MIRSVDKNRFIQEQQLIHIQENPRDCGEIVLNTALDCSRNTHRKCERLFQKPLEPELKYCINLHTARMPNKLK